MFDFGTAAARTFVRPQFHLIGARPSGEMETTEWTKLRIEFWMSLAEYENVKVAAAKKNKSEAELLDHATGNLLRALKQDMQKKDGQVDSAKLRKDGYSDRLLTKLEQA